VPDIPSLKAEFFKALGHPARIRVLEILTDGERTVTELVDAMGVEQPYISQQLAVLRRAGFVDSRRDGAKMVYALGDPRIEELLAVSRDILLRLYTSTRDELRAS
jgi:DNA-binding transcriptional ArsR family regulator